MAEQSPYAEAHRTIGDFFCEFSKLERELGETIKVIFRLEKHEAGDAIVAALGDARKKINLVWAAARMAKNADGSETTTEWKENADEIMRAIHKRNDIRNRLAHSFLEPLIDGSVAVARLQVERGELTGRDKEQWTQKEFEDEIKNLNKQTAKLQLVKSDLSTMKIRLSDVVISAGAGLAAGESTVIGRGAVTDSRSDKKQE
jgi:hypothetical protein